MAFHPYESVGTVCSGKAQAGTKNLQVAINALWDYSLSFGIYNCRLSTAGGSLSVHAEGRAVDIGYPVLPGGIANPLGYLLLERLKRYAWELGIQYIIWDRKSYSRAFPNGKVYTGPNPHIDHLHIEQTWGAAKLSPLTLATAYDLLGEDDVALTPEEQATLDELVSIRRQLVLTGSNLSVILVALKLVRLLRKVDDLFDADEF